MFTTQRRRAQGAVSSSLLFTVIIVIAIAAAGWFLVIRPHMQAVKSDQAPKIVVPKESASKAAPSPANVSAMSTDQLLAEAAKAVSEERLLAPAGNNAFEFYLKVLERDPNNAVAKQALRETFPFGANEAEQEINNRNFNEAQREINLLAKADPDNYTLTILRSKLDAQRKTATKQQQQAQAALLAQQQAAQHRQQQAAAARRKQAQAAQEAVSKKAAEQPKNQTASTSNEAPSAPSQPKVQIQDAVLINSVQARYPRTALRRGQQGWVQVQFTVDTDGKVTKARVVDARPKRVFDRAALNAVDRWKFRPALRNGQPFPVTMSRRIEFKLNQ